MTVVGVEGTGRPPPKPGDAGRGAAGGAAKRDKQGGAASRRRMADSGVQAMLDVFAAEIKEVEEM